MENKETRHNVVELRDRPLRVEGARIIAPETVIQLSEVELWRVTFEVANEALRLSIMRDRQKARVAWLESGAVLEASNRTLKERERAADVSRDVQLERARLVAMEGELRRAEMNERYLGLLAAIRRRSGYRQIHEREPRDNLEPLYPEGISDDMP